MHPCPAIVLINQIYNPMRKTVLFLLLFIQFCATAAAQNVVGTKVFKDKQYTLSCNIVDNGWRTVFHATSLRVSENNQYMPFFDGFDYNLDVLRCDTLIVEEGVDNLSCDILGFNSFRIIKFPQSLKEFESSWKNLGAYAIFCPWQDPIPIGDLHLNRSDIPVLVVPKGRVEAYKNSDWRRYVMFITDSLGDDGSFDRSASLVLENARSYSVSHSVVGSSSVIHIDVHSDYKFDGENNFFNLEDYDYNNSSDGKVYDPSDDVYWSFDKLTLSFDEGITEIPDNFGMDGDVYSYSLPQSLQRIGEYAFEDNDKLVSITIPDNVSYIGRDAFCSCDRLKYVSLPKSCKRLPYELFEDCRALDSIDFPTDLTNIGNYAFKGCNSLFYESGALVLPEGVQTIGDYAFAAACRHINKVVLPKSTKSVGIGAFQWIGSENANVNLGYDGGVYVDETMKLDSIVFDCFASDPPVIIYTGEGYNGIFYHRSSGKARLNVPAQSVEKYKNSPWADEFDIYALDPALDPETSYNPVSPRADLNIEVRNGVVSVSGADSFDVYDLSGRKMPAGRPLPAGLYVVSTPAGSQKVVVE